jgi:hypothetical protein
MSFVNHVSTRKLVGRLLGSEGMKLGGIYLRQAEEELRGFLVIKKKLNGRMF